MPRKMHWSQSNFSRSSVDATKNSIDIPIAHTDELAMVIADSKACLVDDFP